MKDFLSMVRAAHSANPKALPTVQRLVRMRRLQNLTCAQLAERAKMAWTTLDDIECGKTRNPFMTTIERAYEGLGFRLVPVPIKDGWQAPDDLEAAAELLRANGWDVEPPVKRGNFW